MFGLVHANEFDNRNIADKSLLSRSTLSLQKGKTDRARSHPRDCVRTGQANDPAQYRRASHALVGTRVLDQANFENDEPSHGREQIAWLAYCLSSPWAARWFPSRRDTPLPYRLEQMMFRESLAAISVRGLGNSPLRRRPAISTGDTSFRRGVLTDGRKIEFDRQPSST